MNTFYDVQRAREELERSTILEAKSTSDRCNIMEEITETPMTQHWTWPPTFRCLKDNDTELTFQVQAILCGANLPPIPAEDLPTTDRPVKRVQSDLRNLRQHVKLTAFGHPGLNKAIEQLNIIRYELQEKVGPDVTVLPIDFLPYEGHPCIETHARYWTDRHLVPHDQNESFAPMVNPLGSLATIQPATFIHGPDNVVEYCVKKTDAEGNHEFEDYDPALFKPGDIVEVHFAFIAIPIKDNRYKVILNLRTLALLDDGLRKESEFAQSNAIRASTIAHHSSPTKLKRKRLCGTKGKGASSVKRAIVSAERATVHSTQHEGMGDVDMR